MKYLPEERNWEKEGVWPDFWPKYFEHGNMPIVWHLHLNALRHPKKTAIIFYGTRISYKELEQLVLHAAGGLKKLGVEKGDRVYLGMQNCPQFIISYYAAMAVGAVIIGGSPMFKQGELRYILNDCEARVAIIEEDNYPVFQSVRDQVPVESVVVTSLNEFVPDNPEIPVPPGMVVEGLDYSGAIDWKDFIKSEPVEKYLELDIDKDLACLQYTSGTTGVPKGAMLTHRNILVNAIQLPIILGGHADSVYGAVVPIFHITGMQNNMNGPIFLGATIVLFTRFDTEVFLQASELYKITSWVAITTMNIAVINHPTLNKYDLSSYEAIGTGGAPVPAELIKRYKDQFGLDLIDGWGMSETASAPLASPTGHVKAGSCGIVVRGFDVRVADLVDPTKNVPRGQEGEMWMRGPSIAREYWRQPPEAQAESFKEEGWLATGDVIIMDEDGYIFIVGRTKEMIKASGYSVFPAEVEKYLYQYPAIKEVCIIGVPHEYRGEDVKAYIVLKDEYKGKVTEEEIMNWAKDQMSVYKYPRQIEFRDELPKSATGKIMRKILKEELQGN